MGSLREQEHMAALAGSAGSLPVTAQAVGGQTCGRRNQALLEKL